MTTALASAPSKIAAEKRASNARVRRNRGGRGANITLGLLAWVIGILFVFPVVWMLLTSLHSEVNAATNPPSFFAPLTLDGYREFFGASSGASPWPPLINSATASIVSTIVVIILAIPAAYALSVKPVEKWTDVMFFFLSTKFLPAVAGLLPLYIIQQFDSVFTLTAGAYGTANLPYTVYQTLYNAQDYGLASAQGVIVVIGTIIVATFTLRTVSSLFEEGN